MHRIAVLDDYQSVAADFADWSTRPRARRRRRVPRPPRRRGRARRAARRPSTSSSPCASGRRSRAALLERLPNLRLLVTTGRRNASIDVAAATERGITVCGTGLARHRHRRADVGADPRRRRATSRRRTPPSAPAAGRRPSASTSPAPRLGVVGLGAARGARSPGSVRRSAWTSSRGARTSPTSAPPRSASGGSSEDELFATADVVTVHLLLSDRTRGLVGADDFARMKPTAVFVNTSRGPIVDEQALTRRADRAARIARRRARRLRPGAAAARPPAPHRSRGPCSPRTSATSPRRPTRSSTARPSRTSPPGSAGQPIRTLT